MTARVGSGLLISALVVLACWLLVGAVSAAAEPRAGADAWSGTGETVAAPLVPGGGTGAGARGSSDADAASGTGGAGGPNGTGAQDGTGATGGLGATGGPGGPGGPGGTGGTGGPGETGGPGATGTSGPSANPGTPSVTPALAAVDPVWAAGVAQATGIPQRALIGYAGAALSLQREQPTCSVGWNTIAALGWIESGHGTHGGSAIGVGGPNDGVTTPRILGPALDGGEFDAIDDTDAGTLDGDPDGDRAVGPMQFIPSTWQTWGADGSGDGVADPQQIDDASLAAARYLCHYGDLGDAGTWRTAVFAYNHVESYVDSVAATANQYAAQAAAVSETSGAGG
ncbi:lytic transglycosylase domain-containing protein [Herbiconiux ginsengi]|uniref:Transglycosylase SLT domain-containing protein n=1 Tax=Herbiconiux ginsengi TaxID=381665 RepID=A0A1H3QKY3_9MICO|nr:lytic transglycosylase domain-containing protein [Herbiconiux ginsengi]SDZ13698.1 Transglycosylase SLT domain-containing protein [Herbiconiux ginsengi]